MTNHIAEQLLNPSRTTIRCSEDLASPAFSSGAPLSLFEGGDFSSPLRAPLRLSASLRFLLPFLLFLFCFASPTPAQLTASTAPKPKVRTITAFVAVDRSRYQIDFSEAISFLHKAQTTFEQHGYTVQTLRIATQPFPDYTSGMTHDEVLRFFKSLDDIAQQEKIMIAIGPAYLTGEDGDAQAALLADILQNTKSLYGTVVVANKDTVDWPAVHAAARVIKQLSEQTPHSEGDLRFAAIANVPAYSPFFPAAYHTGSGQQFAVGLESANTVTAAFNGATDYANAKRRLIDLYYPQAFDIEDIGEKLDSMFNWSYLGLDLSPVPGKDASIGAAIEALSKQPVGTSGTLSAVATITSGLKGIGARKVGYSGLMLPILEDQRLVERWNAGLLSLDALLSYSAVCGTGLDTIPLPGNTSEDTLSRIIGDVASLSVKWDKPLTARLLPIAGKHAGEQTEFSNPSFINGLIQPLVTPESVR
jgi:hypothetical protein